VPKVLKDSAMVRWSIAFFLFVAAAVDPCEGCVGSIRCWSMQNYWEYHTKGSSWLQVKKKKVKEREMEERENVEEEEQIIEREAENVEEGANNSSTPETPAGAENSSSPEKKDSKAVEHAKDSKKPGNSKVKPEAPHNSKKNNGKPNHSKEKPEDSEKKPGETTKGLIDPSDAGNKFDKKGYVGDWRHEWKSKAKGNGSKDSKEKPEDSENKTKKELIDPSDVGKADIDKKGYDQDWVHEWKATDGTSGPKHVTSWHSTKNNATTGSGRMGLVLAVVTSAFGLLALGVI